MSKYVTFYPEENTARIRAEFWNGNLMSTSKYLTNVEDDALTELYEGEGLPFTIPAEELEQAMEYLCFDNDGEPTNFEHMLFNLIEEENK
jgi:hypothetical protein